jgi:hypothetical protein
VTDTAGSKKNGYIYITSQLGCFAASAQRCFFYGTGFNLRHLLVSHKQSENNNKFQAQKQTNKERNDRLCFRATPFTQ